MAAHFLFCSSSSDSKKQNSKASKFSKSTSPVDPLYESVPVRTKYSESNRGKHTFEQTGRQPLAFQQTPKQPATVLSSYSSPSAGQSQELSVVSGETVHVLHQDQRWSYVVNRQNRLGYVPSAVLEGRGEDSSTTMTGTRSETHMTNPQASPATPTDSVYSRVSKTLRSRSSSTSSRVLAASPHQNCDNFHNSFTTFSKSPRESRTLLYSYMPGQENDLTVRKGERITVLNSSDQDWLWVVRGDGEEGFIPASYTAPVSSNGYGNGLVAAQHKHSKLTKQYSHSTGYRSSSSVTNSNNQLSAAFSDQLRVTPVRSLPRSPVNGDPPCYLQPSSEPTADRHRPHRRGKSPERVPARKSRSKTPDVLYQNRNSLDYFDKKHSIAISPIPQVSEPHRNPSSLQSPCNSPILTVQNRYNQPVQRPTRPAPSPPGPEEYIYQNLRLVYPNSPALYPQQLSAGMLENIYVNTLGVDANGKPSLVPSIMTMQDRVQLLDKFPVHFPHSTSDNSLGHTSSLGDITSVSEFNQHYMNSRILKEDMV